MDIAFNIGTEVQMYSAGLIVVYIFPNLET